MKVLVNNSFELLFVARLSFVYRQKTSSLSYCLIAVISVVKVATHKATYCGQLKRRHTRLTEVLKRVKARKESFMVDKSEPAEELSSKRQENFRLKKTAAELILSI